MLMQIGSRFLQRMSPVGLLLAGTVLALSIPPVRKGIRSAAVMTTRSILMAAGAVQHTGSAIREEVMDIVAEAKETECPMCATLAKRQRRLAHATSQGLQNVSAKTKELSDKLKRFADEDHLQAPAVRDGLEDDDLSLKPV